jgi:hypothetical protein
MHSDGQPEFSNRSGFRYGGAWLLRTFVIFSILQPTDHRLGREPMAGGVAAGTLHGKPAERERTLSPERGGVAALALHTRFSHHVADVSIASASERTNLDVVKAIRALLDELVLSGGIGRRDGLVTFVADPPGHDLRYGIDPTRISTELGWQPRETFETGLRKTVERYLVNRIRSGVFRGERLGVLA